MIILMPLLSKACVLWGVCSKCRPAKPQPFLRAEGPGTTYARNNGENAAGGFFQQASDRKKKNLGYAKKGMMLEQGEELLIVHRRLFEKNTGRFFIGDVQAYEHGMEKVKGVYICERYVDWRSIRGLTFVLR